MGKLDLFWNLFLGTCHKNGFPLFPSESRGKRKRLFDLESQMRVSQSLKMIEVFKLEMDGNLEQN